MNHESPQRRSLQTAAFKFGTRLPRRCLALTLALALGLALPCAADDIRIRRDELRDRTWILRGDALYSYEYGPGGTSRRFALPGWIHVSARNACAPDVFIEAGGSVIVSSNIVPSLWRVDPTVANAVELSMEVSPATRKDFGFASLQTTENGELHGRGSIDRSLWLVDLANRSAIQLDETHATSCD